MPSGWIKLHRRLLENPIWAEKPFSKGQAWVDLLLLAEYENKGDYKAGRVYRSKEWLARRWGWSSKKVRLFLDGLTKDATIGLTDRRTHGTIVTIENWAFFQGEGRTEGTTKGRTKGRTEGDYLKKNKNIGVGGGGLTPPSTAETVRNGVRYRKIKNADGDWEMIPVEGGDEN